MKSARKNNNNELIYPTLLSHGAPRLFLFLFRQSWSKKIGVSPSQLLLHLSFASILGGTVTIIGTSTNLVVVGLLAERYPNDYAEEVGQKSICSVKLSSVSIILFGTALVFVLL